ncbi:MAG: ABC transporter ATP-binding protein [Clostridia bacterium]|nr:ABC transporter ATP-binding protein [Clostridia bacterium]MBQ5833824.1 ABC transporter ATP-binding protein [Clostridia bacterium]
MSKNRKRLSFDSKTALRVLREMKHHRLSLLLSLLFAAASVFLTLYIPLLTGDAIDLILEKGNVDLTGVTRIVLQIGICTLLCALSQWLMNVLNNRITYAMVRKLRRRTFEKLQRLPISYLDGHSVGDTVSRMMTDVDQLTDGLLLGFSQFFTGILTILGTLVIMLFLHPGIALVVIFVTPLSLFVASFIAKRTYSMFRLQSETRAEQTALIEEYVGQHKTVAAFGYEKEAQEAFDEVNDRLGKCALRATFFSSLTNPCTRFVNNLVYAGVALVGALLCFGGGNLSVGGLSKFLSYANQYTKPFNEISGVLTELQNALACASRVFEILDEPEILPDEPNALVLQDAEGSIALENVAFSYTPEQDLIRGLHLSVSPGERIAIVGPTGCGKTTLINLLMRFYDVCDGSIRIDGTDLREITRGSLRASWGMVLQDTWLRAATVRENICMAKPDATNEEMIAAAKAAHAHSFIKRLPKGYDTVLGEGGGSLSQGQKQLLCIARVMLALPPMLILDEATSSIDTRMEGKIQKAFAQMMHGRTSFIVAHRLSTIESADVILVMKSGKVIEQGDHASLLAQKGFYYTLYNSQFES